MSAGGKGDKRVPMTITRQEFVSNWDKAFANVPLICTACNTEPCECERTDDGPGQGSDEVKTNYERRYFEGDL